ncbi:Retrotransposon gag protein [Gossypium australe]|uniref:Retrotransposon gag protein n=1 Tax=Gossypium australe TaxID=47621 RepID=A0A5B6WUJ7_9ROSI|nr:Retrotransposon gag protein [Gossypium australe]
MIQQYVKFDGLQDEDPNAHLANSLEIFNTFKINGGSVLTWDQMIKKFLLKYFPPAKTAKMRNDISSFSQINLETLYDAWERFKDFLKRCPHCGLPLWLHVQTFYNNLNPSTRQLIDAIASETLTNKTLEVAQEFIEEMTLYNY